MVQAYAAMTPGGVLEPFEFEPGTLRPDEVEVAVEYCGICHSDLSMLNNDWGMSEYPLVPGHEVAGVVSRIGSDVDHLLPGQRVGIGWHAGYCNSCEPCQTADHNLCASATGTIVGRHGGFASHVKAAANSVVAIPDGLAMRSVGPLFCGGVTVFNPLVQFDVKPTSRVAVIGIGGLGHLALQFLNAWGCNVTAFTSNEQKKQEALRLGAHQTLSSLQPDDLVAAAGHFDLIICTVNVSLNWDLYLKTLKPGGRFHFVGAPLEPLTIAVPLLLDRQISISGSPVGSPATIAKMLDFATVHGIAPVLETYPMEQVNHALDRLRRGEVRYRAVLCRDH